MRIAVTGVSGFIGSAVATELMRLRHDVTGFSRTPGRWDGEFERWDIGTGPRPATTGFDAVVHCAALADDWAPLAESMRVNRDGTANMLASFPATRLVHLSTSSVYDAFVPTVDVAETAGPASRFLSAYSRSKAAAEHELDGADAVILRPHAVYGPGDTTLLPRILARIRGGRLAIPAGARVRHTLTHIDNLVAAVLLAIEPASPPGIYNIGDESAVSLADVIGEMLAKQRRSGVRIIAVPYRVAFAAAGLLELVHRAGVPGRPAVTRYAISQFGIERTLDLSRARRNLGYRPKPTSLDGAESW